MTAVRFDPTTARDLHDALRILEGRLQGTGRRLSPGALEIRAACEVSLGVRRGQALDHPAERDDDEVVLTLLTYEDVADRLQVSVSTVKRLVKSEQIDIVQIGSNSRIRPVDLQAYIDALPTKESA